MAVFEEYGGMGLTVALGLLSLHVMALAGHLERRCETRRCFRLSIFWMKSLEGFDDKVAIFDVLYRCTKKSS